MVGPSPQDIKLPLVDHFMGEGIADFLLNERGSLCEPFKQGKRETDFSPVNSRQPRRGSRSSAADKEADGGRQASAPLDSNGGKETGEIAPIETTPLLLQRILREGVGLEGRPNVHRH